MNYRHQFHAGNFADVMKHTLLVRLIHALQQKEKPFLYLDTHAGRGGYDLAAAQSGGSLARRPEWPEGIGRLANNTSIGESVAEFVQLVRTFDARAGNSDREIRYYPGSPRIARLLMRPQDRMALGERHPAEFAALADEFRGEPRVSVHEIDGYVAMRAMLPPPERRALVLIDPPFEAQDEFAQVASALHAALERFATGVYAVWYPLTERARVDEFLAAVHELKPPPTVAIELTIAGAGSGIKMKGCGLLVVNPPWRFVDDAKKIADDLSVQLAQAPGGGARIDWIVPET